MRCVLDVRSQIECRTYSIICLRRKVRVMLLIKYCVKYKLWGF
nr:MAG TPA: hypothetical protein [Caudoviricetes sp.]